MLDETKRGASALPAREPPLVSAPYMQARALAEKKPLEDGRQSWGRTAGRSQEGGGLRGERETMIEGCSSRWLLGVNDRRPDT